jgi:hypothetical protein
MKLFPTYPIKTLNDALDFIRHVQRERKTDAQEFELVKNKVINSRKVDKIPTGSSDVTSTDAIGDFNFDGSYFYVLVNVSGTPSWRRSTLGSW